MKHVALVAALVIAFSSAIETRDSEACTTFLLKSSGQSVLGKSYDWHMDQGLVFINKRGLKKRALPARLLAKTASWTSKYASLTFNQYGREFPNGGINEKGLAIEIMWLDDSRYPKADDRETVNELQWIQYQLDRYSSLEQVVAHADDLRVTPVSGRVHYLACDRTRRCASFEYLGGKLTINKGADVVALTNHTSAESSSYLKTHRGFGGAKLVKSSSGSLDRFVRASRWVKMRRKIRNLKTRAFRVLEDVSQGDYSVWKIVYELDSQRVHFRSHKHSSIKSVDWKSMDLSCKTPALYFDMASDLEGDVSKHFRAYSESANLKLVAKSLAEVKELPPGAEKVISAYPSTLSCTL